MIKLSNGHKVLTAYVSRIANTDRSWGLVLAETPSDFVTWNVWQVGEGDPLFEAETGHYFSKIEENARQRAEIDFGKRLAQHLSANAYEGLKEKCEP